MRRVCTRGEQTLSKEFFELPEQTEPRRDVFGKKGLIEDLFGDAGIVGQKKHLAIVAERAKEERAALDKALVEACSDVAKEQARPAQRRLEKRCYDE